jgi:hypothetical protein
MPLLVLAPSTAAIWIIARRPAERLA